MISDKNSSIMQILMYYQSQQKKVHACRSVTKGYSNTMSFSILLAPNNRIASKNAAFQVYDGMELIV
jgi:hypothetical protein